MENIILELVRYKDTETFLVFKDITGDGTWKHLPPVYKPNTVQGLTFNEHGYFTKWKNTPLDDITKWWDSIDRTEHLSKEGNLIQLIWKTH